MGNCCVCLGNGAQNNKKTKKKQNPFATDFGGANGNEGGDRLCVLKDPTGKDISAQYDLGRELGRGEFGVTYLCTDLSSGEKYACKSISKKKLRTAVDIEDVRREVEIMRHLPQHPNIVSLKDTYEDDEAVHIVMELCEGGELFDRIVARGHYTERAAAAVMRTIVEIVQVGFYCSFVVLIWNMVLYIWDMIQFALYYAGWFVMILFCGSLFAVCRFQGKGDLLYIIDAELVFVYALL